MFMLNMYIMELYNLFGKYRIVYVNKEKHLIICDCGDTFKYYDNCYYVELCKP